MSAPCVRTLPSSRHDRVLCWSSEARAKCKTEKPSCAGTLLWCWTEVDKLVWIQDRIRCACSLWCWQINFKSITSNITSGVKQVGNTAEELQTRPAGPSRDNRAMPMGNVPPIALILSVLLWVSGKPVGIPIWHKSSLFQKTFNYSYSWQWLNQAPSEDL